MNGLRIIIFSLIFYPLCIACSDVAMDAEEEKKGIIYSSYSPPTDIQTQAKLVLERYKYYILSTNSSENIDELVSKLNEDGRWTDINYENKSSTDWKIVQHLNRIYKMALAWSDNNTKYYHQQSLWDKMMAALSDWTANKYQSTNWWYNQVNVPSYMRDIIILLKENMNEEQIEKLLDIMSQFEIPKPGEGANTIWAADIGFHYGLLSKDFELTETCFTVLIDEIKIVDKPDGILPDFSFQQHGARLQMYQYGSSFATGCIRIAWQTRGTLWVFPKEKTDILSDFILEGWQWMARGINTVPGTIDRSVSRRNELRKADIRFLLPYLEELVPNRRQELAEMLDNQNGKGSLNGFRYFPYSDFVVYHQNGFSFFLKTISDRTLPTESINEENLKGQLLNSGDSYILTNGNEYYNLMPAWDWNKLPGITSFSDASKIERKKFVGSVGNGESGLTVMDYCMTNKNETKNLSAKKLWACHNGIIVYMIADIKTKGNISSIYTILEQSRLQGDVIVNNTGNSLIQGKHNIDGTNWIFHNNMVYMFPEPTSTNIDITNTEGNWLSINKGQNNITVKENIFMPIVYHDLEKSNSLVYAQTYCDSPNKSEALLKSLQWTIIKNTKDCQAIEFDDGTSMISFYSAKSLNIGKKIITTDSPCILIIKNNRIVLRDPTNNLLNLTLSINGIKKEVSLIPFQSTEIAF